MYDTMYIYCMNVYQICLHLIAINDFDVTNITSLLVLTRYSDGKHST